ncbi:Hypothetical protein LUCI_3799 [Lucifera butyrica]|uniref:Uncharacterized protein n=1 Tax=Lucifera butyrica TaxID=1351585 RepID=A0A498RAR4_9FIRM|nr:Hypothetical protein LUCI_3799 [Lucifera butyrica]
MISNKFMNRLGMAMRNEVVGNSAKWLGIHTLQKREENKHEE